jgi:four helix bundle protein
MKENILLDKSFNFSIRIINLYKYLSNNKKEYILSKQLLKCGTSVGANINEAQEAQSISDFISKLSISLKEAREAKYWLELLKATEYLTTKEADSIHKDLIELLKLLVSIIKTSKQKRIKNENR